MDCSFAADNTFGPVVADCRRTFDFTLLFEDIFFYLIPSIIFLLGGIVEIVVLCRRPARQASRYLLIVKLGAIVCYVVSETILLALISARDPTERTTASIPAASLTLCAALLLLPLSFLNVTRSVRSSFMTVGYLSITLLLRTASIRTYWLIGETRPFAYVSLVALPLQVILIATEGCGTATLSLDGKPISEEESAGLLSRSFFTWINRLFLMGYRRSITAADLKPIDSALSAENSSAAFARLHGSAIDRQSGLVVRTLRCLGISLFKPIPARLLLTGFTFAQPFLTTSLISYFGSTEVNNDNNGYGLIGACFLVYTGLAISTGWYWQLAYKFSVKMRGDLSQAIFKKMMILGHEKNIDSKVMTLMISDLQRIISAAVFVHELWIAPLETGLATWLLWRQIGPATFGVLGIAIVCTFGSVWISKVVGRQQQAWLSATETRISATKTMLQSIKAIKMMGIGDKIGASVQMLRKLEFTASKPYRVSVVGTVLASYSTLTLAPVVAFGMFIGIAHASNTELDASRLFTSLILISLLASPLMHLLQILPAFGAALGCFARIDEFLQKPELMKARKLLDEGLACDDQAVEELHVLPKHTSMSDEKRHTQSLGDNTVVFIKNASFGWEDKPLLSDINLHVEKGENIAIMGPVGSGKSLLLQAILGEVEPKCGTVEVLKSPIGYCSQTPWLENVSVRENILRGVTGDDLWFGTVMQACALEEFLNKANSIEPVGTGGTKLSGGQRQRLALARAVAMRPSILLLDDALSAVDRRTQKVILRNLFGPQSLCKKHGITVIQVTQSWHVAQAADRVLTISSEGNLEQTLVASQICTEERGELAITDDNQQPEMIFGESTNGKTSPSAGDQRKTQITDRSVYGTYLGSIKRWDLTFFFIFALAFSFSLKFPDIWVTWWSQASDEDQSIGYWLGLFGLLSCLPLVMIGLWVAHLMLRVIPQSGVGLHTKLLRTVLDAPFAFLTKIDHGSIINRFNQDLMLVDFNLPLTLLNSVSTLLICIMQSVLVAVGGAVYILAAFPLLILVLFLIQHFYLRTSKQLRHLELESKSGLHTVVSECWQGIVTIRAHGWTRKVQSDFDKKLDDSQEPLYLLYVVQTWLRFILALVVAGLSVAITGIAVATKHKTAASGIGLAFLNLVSLGEMLTNFITSWTSLETSLGAIARIKAFEEDTPREPAVEEAIDVSKSWPEHGRISFHNVWATYESSQEQKTTWALRDVSLQVAAGERLAVCGRTGSGKSTMLLSLLGLIDVPRGSIMFDGVDIARVPRSILRSRVHVISQDNFVQQGHGVTIREALGRDSDALDSTVREVLLDCALLERIDALGGLDAPIDNLSLSTGQTQLFILARTILNAGRDGGRIILFDEATSSIDPETEVRINTILRERLRGCTIISILHRLETALTFDRVLVLADGEVEASGTPAEIVQKSDMFAEFRGRI